MGMEFSEHIATSKLEWITKWEELNEALWFFKNELADLKGEVAETNKENEEKGKEGIYREFLKYYHSARKELLAFRKQGKLKILDGEDIWSDRFISLIIKESRLDKRAKSPTWAKGYFQLTQIAIDEVNKLFKKDNIKFNKYDPKNKPRDNILYGILYFLHVEDQFQKAFPYIQRNDVDKFVLASYNAWITKIKALLVESWAINRDQFVSYVTKKLMSLSWKFVYERSPAYHVDFRNFFDKNYQGDTTSIFQKDIMVSVKKNNKLVNEKKTIILTKTKAQEFTQYAELIFAIQREIDDTADDSIIKANIEIKKTKKKEIPKKKEAPKKKPQSKKKPQQKLRQKTKN